MRPQVDFKAQNPHENASVNEAMAYKTVLADAGLNFVGIYACPTTMEGGNFTNQFNNGLDNQDGNFVPIGALVGVLPDDQLHLFLKSDQDTFHNVGLVRDRFVVNQYPVQLVVEQLRVEINQK